ncbi:endonuclease [Flagellimonas lutimaris]|uniref:Endonuclease n=1 Tax=Flagellimonas lutimaris TaxID=475082 RepID=A0A3A1N722_9FLAO|nr:endonuclease/exonuclease/phosphatase family protein [Allomuricauda lutimaris]RIV31594.1 endonuclease [Allomuricauda lutimaris]
MIQRLVLLIFLLIAHCIVHAQSNEIHMISWNIKDFGRTKNTKELNEIAEIVRDADILAIQEVVAGYGGAQAVARLTDILNRMGAKWDYVISDPTNSPKYVTERYAIIWKTKNIKIKNRGRLISGLDSIIDREPFILKLYTEGKHINLIDYHSRPYDKDPESEIKALSHYVRDSLTNTPVILAGDFNVDEKMPIFNIMRSNGYKAAISNKKTTLKWECNGDDYLNYAIDNIFYSREIFFIKSRTINFVRSCEQLEKARRLSDHLPVSMTFSIK